MNDPMISKYHNVKEQLNRMKEQSAKLSGKIEGFREELEKLGFKTIEEAITWLKEAQEEEREFENEIQSLMVQAEGLLK